MAREMGITEEGRKAGEAWKRICEELRARVGENCEADIQAVDEALTYFFARQLEVKE